MERIVLLVLFGVLYVHSAPEPHVMSEDTELENRNSSKSDAVPKTIDVPDDADVPTGKKNVPEPDNKVSDVLDAAISGIQFGIELGATNGTLNKLCLKIGGVNLTGCRRTVDVGPKSEEIKEVPEIDVPKVVNN